VQSFKLFTVPSPAVNDRSPVASHVAKHQAVLAGAVDPEGVDTRYQFQYGPSTGYGQETQLTDIPAGFTDVASAPVLLSGLQPGTVYHYRLVASNAVGTTEGPDQTFTTLPLTPPTASTGTSANITQSTATLTGTANTQGLPGTYTLELGTSPGVYLAVAFSQLAAQAGEQPLAIALSSLAPGTTYYYRIVAATVDGSSQGAQGAFTTATIPPPPAPTILTAPDLAGLTPLPAAKEPAVKTPKKKVKAKAKQCKKGQVRKQGKCVTKGNAKKSNRRTK
jgi:phosphodiesterase/alkaline phosphatase D-like protein